ncbi:FAD-dependent monooxygenase [Streptomyces gamaensis]|uniref:FAD-dependent monooxygenase n=1 Tax=Streptomyces gamaensis TaxID=1763542 RepID=A0ABW0Z3K0_9ACTN
MSTCTPTAPGRAVVLGAGMAGLLAAAALAGHAEEVVVLDRDRLPAGAAPRKGLPQARHAHLLMSGGVRTVEELLPGTQRSWAAAGVRRIGLPDGLVAQSPEGWYPRRPGEEYVLTGTRDLLDAVLRERVRALPGVELREGTEAVALLGDARRVTGVRVRDAATGAQGSLEAALVVDASGRGAQSLQRLAGIGLPPVREESVDSGLVYASRFFAAPGGDGPFPLVSVQPDRVAGRPGQGAVLVPVEDGRWLVTLSGTRGGEPSREEGEFERFARRLRHPLIADLIARATPLSGVHLTRSTVNRRRFHERSSVWPEGFVATGDAVATFNPVYGQGMSVAARSAAVLRAVLGERPLGSAGLARRAQRRIGRVVAGSWELAVGEDSTYPGVVGRRPPLGTRLLHGYVQRMMRTATVDPLVLRSLMAVMTMSAPVTELLRPAVALAVARGPGRTRPDGPPITAAELALCGLEPRRPAGPC